MAARLDTWPGGLNGRREKYPWDEWLDGSIWLLTRGLDFAVTVENFRAVAFAAAKRNGLALRTTRDGDHLAIQARPKSQGLALVA